MNEIIIKREFAGIGWIDKMNFILTDSMKSISLRSYNGCLCFQLKNKRIGFKTWRKNSKLINQKLIEIIPF